MNVALNGKLLQEVECFKYLGFHGGISEGYKWRSEAQNEECRNGVWCNEKSGMNTKSTVHEVGGILTTLYGTNILKYGKNREKAESNGDQVFKKNNQHL